MLHTHQFNLHNSLLPCVIAVAHLSNLVSAHTITYFSAKYSTEVFVFHPSFRLKSSKMAGRSIYHYVRRTLELEAVDVDKVEIVRFDQQPYIYTHGLNGCFCVTIVSQNAAILSHIQAGSANRVLRDVAELGGDNLSYFQDACVTVCFSPDFPGPLVDHVKSETNRVFGQILGLTPFHINYPLIQYGASDPLLPPDHPSGTIVVDGSNHRSEVIVWREDEPILAFRQGRVTRSRLPSPSSRISAPRESSSSPASSAQGDRGHPSGSRSREQGYRGDSPSEPERRSRSPRDDSRYLSAQSSSRSREPERSSQDALGRSRSREPERSSRDVLGRSRSREPERSSGDARRTPRPRELQPSSRGEARYPPSSSRSRSRDPPQSSSRSRR